MSEHQGEEYYGSPESPVWGDEPNELVRRFEDQLPEGPLLDLGSGDGRNALYLAKQGREVTCVDKAPQAISRLMAFAQKAGIDSRISGKAEDMTELELEEQFSGVIASYSLQLLDPQPLPRLVAQLDRYTLPQGLNIIEDFSGEDTRGPDWIVGGELAKAYEALGWEILENSKGKARYLYPKDLNNVVRETIRVVARKPLV